MKCKFCDGSGKDYWELNGVPYPCPVCNGTGEIKDEPHKKVEQTNEEWFDGLSTEEKAKIIKMMINICISCEEHGTVRTRGCLLRQNMAKGLLFLPCMDEDGIVEWLKQPHTAK